MIWILNFKKGRSNFLNFNLGDTSWFALNFQNYVWLKVEWWFLFERYFDFKEQIL